MATETKEGRRWTIRVCEECGEPVGSASTGHRHKPPRNGIFTYADVREVAVVPQARLEAAEKALTEAQEDGARQLHWKEDYRGKLEALNDAIAELLDDETIVRLYNLADTKPKEQEETADAR